MITDAGASAADEAVLILGMHRSATSVLTRVLNLHGFPLSRHLLGSNFSNPFGHWESSEAITINDDLLATVGRKWDDIRRLPKGWADTPAAFEAKQRIKILLESDFKSCGQWLMKEPRICRLAPIWLDVIQSLGYNVKIIIPVRPVAEVALSLLRRDGMPIDKGALLWLDHVLEAELWSRGLPRAFVSHSQIVEDWRGALEYVTSSLNLKLSAPDSEEIKLIDATINESGVNTAKYSDSESPFFETEIQDACDELYSILIEGCNESLRARLDELRFLRNSVCIGIETAYRDVERRRHRKEEKSTREVAASQVIKNFDERLQLLEKNYQAFDNASQHHPAIAEEEAIIFSDHENSSESQASQVQDQVPSPNSADPKN